MCVTCFIEADGSNISHEKQLLIDIIKSCYTLGICYTSSIRMERTRD